MDEVVLPGDPPIELELKTSARARRLSLRVSQLDGRVTLTVPRGACRDEAIAFAREKESWLRAHLDRRPDAIRPAPGGSIPFEGRPHQLVTARIRAPRLGDGVIELPETAPEKTGARLAALFKHLARQRLSAVCAQHAAALDREVNRITLRDTRSRWGSCSHQGNLMFSWRLIMAPAEVLDYVAAHEVAHLVHMNHSPAYWAEVSRIAPDYRTQRAWLRKNSAALHRYRFRD